MTAAAITQLLTTYGPWGVAGFMSWLFLKEQKSRDSDRQSHASLVKEKDAEIRELAAQVVTLATQASSTQQGLIAVLGSPRK